MTRRNEEAELGVDPTREELLESQTTLGGPTAAFADTVELISRFRGGDRGALDRLSTRYIQRVRVVVRSRFPERYRSVIDVDDVVQRTFVAAFRNIERFEHRDEGSFMRWLSTIAIHECNAVHDYMIAGKRGGGRSPHLESMVLRSSDDGAAGLDPAASVDLPAEIATQTERDTEGAASMLHTRARIALGRILKSRGLGE